MLLGWADADLVEVAQQVGRVVVDAVGAGRLQLVTPLAAGEETDAEGAGAAGGEEIPDAVSDDDRLVDRDAETVGGGVGNYVMVRCPCPVGIRLAAQQKAVA